MRVSVISTGQVRIRPEHAATRRTPLAWWLLTSRRWTAPRPINVYVIEHAGGLVLFDTGQDRVSVTDPHYFPRGIPGFLYRRLARFEIGADETLTARLASAGYDIADVTTVVLSHLHQDHIGGLPELAHATIVVSEVEWASLDAPLAVLTGLMVDHIRLPDLRWMPVVPAPTADESLAPFTAAHDLVGDGTLLLLPTPGHTPGSLSLLLRAPGVPPMLFVGDLTYDIHLMDDVHVPGVGSRRALEDTTRAVNALRERHPGMLVLAAHDPAAAGLLEGATR